METPILDYIREMLDEHIAPLANGEGGLVLAVWLVGAIHTLEGKYKQSGML